MMIRPVLCMLMALFMAAPALAQIDNGPPRVGAPPWQTIQLEHRSQRYPFAVYASRALTPGTLAHIRHVVVMVHGVRRDADHYYETAAGVLWQDPDALQDTLVLAPRFVSTVDRGFAGMPAWQRGRWIDGEESAKVAGRAGPVGSFDVLDDLLRRLADRREMPDLQDIVLAGHSAGAQLIQRYAVLNDIDETLRARGVAVRYVVANPSSYLYFTTDRPRGDGGFGPYNRGNCPDFNDYRYGVDHPPRGVHVPDPARLASRYARRQVTYLLGDADNNPEHRLLDKRCAAEAQGATRLARGRGYLRYEAWLPALKGSVHRAYEVIGVGHDQRGMYGSTCGARALLGREVSMPPGAAACTAPRLRPDG
jgi:hypothetical protein